MHEKTLVPPLGIIGSMMIKPELARWKGNIFGPVNFEGT
jgi:hypothetical protein